MGSTTIEETPETVCSGARQTGRVLEDLTEEGKSERSPGRQEGRGQEGEKEEFPI